MENINYKIHLIIIFLFFDRTVSFQPAMKNDQDDDDNAADGNTNEYTSTTSISFTVNNLGNVGIGST